MAADVHHFGIRHHGPGSARRVLEALEDLDPVEVLIEGPADLSDQIPLLADPAMVPPVALMAYPKDQPEHTSFWPFALFSPEFQAARWALAKGRPVRFIDLPVAWRAPRDAPLVDEDAEGDAPVEDAALPVPSLLYRDPIGELARAAGYDDGESWWRDVIEENPDPGPIFAAVADAMTALRETDPDPIPEFEATREAHMRLEIAKSAKTAEGPIAVVCGAWHVPGLRAKVAQKVDRARLKSAPKTRVTATWAPWTSPRLAAASGYGAGVTAPGWCKHLWDHSGPDQTTLWIARMARALREDGQIVSTASLIEAERLATSLAAVRDRPRPGFDELREAVIACLCYGNPLIWDSVAPALLFGNEVGEIPADVPSAPLLDDLARQQKKARLKPEALEKELSLDLRSEAGLFRSTLLHRLLALDVPWGRLTDAGRSRGTFRERWVLRWEPEYAVALVENLIHGATIAQAASGRTVQRMGTADRLGVLVDLTLAAMTAQLDDAAARGVDRLTTMAAQTSDCGELLAALPGLAEILRYGRARAIDTDRLSDLFRRIAIQAAIALPYAARNLDKEAAQLFRAALSSADEAIHLVELGDDVTEGWTAALHDLLDDTQANRLVMGTAARRLYGNDALSTEEAVRLLGRMLSPGTAVAEAAGFFEGFFDGSGQSLLYDADLRGAVDSWMMALDGETFTEHLPLFRRVLSELDKTERARLIDTLFGRGAADQSRVLTEAAETLWPAHFAQLTDIMKKGAPHV